LAAEIARNEEELSLCCFINVKTWSVDELVLEFLGSLNPPKEFFFGSGGGK
jgi:hypothetical protein